MTDKRATVNRYGVDVVSVSIESAEQTDRRPRAVIATAELVVYDGVWRFYQTPIAHPPALGPDMLAVVRDEHTWSYLAPAGDATADVELFGLVSFHFPPGLDNSGFVGWLAGHLKAELGTGLFVVCGYNSEWGGCLRLQRVPDRHVRSGGRGDSPAAWGATRLKLGGDRGTDCGHRPVHVRTRTTHPIARPGIFKAAIPTPPPANSTPPSHAAPFMTRCGGTQV